MCIQGLDLERDTKSEDVIFHNGKSFSDKVYVCFPLVWFTRNTHVNKRGNCFYVIKGYRQDIYYPQHHLGAKINFISQTLLEPVMFQNFAYFLNFYHDL